MTEKLVIDIHLKYETLVPEELPDNVIGVILKITEAEGYEYETEHKVLDMIKRIYDTGRLVGLYHFYRSFTYSDPNYKQLGIYQLDNYLENSLPVSNLLAWEVLDLETYYSTQWKRELNPPHKDIITDIFEFFSGLHKNRPGSKHLLYSNQNTFQVWGLHDWYGKFKYQDETWWMMEMVDYLWEAYYSSQEPGGLSPLESKQYLWQYTDKAYVSGVYDPSGKDPTQVDVNRIQIPFYQFLESISEDRRGMFTLLNKEKTDEANIQTVPIIRRGPGSRGPHRVKPR